MKDLAIIVPARLGSQRFPRKLLYPVLGKPLVLHTAENIRRIAPDIPLYFAVAEKELGSLLEGAGFHCINTDPHLPSGTDRIAVANRTVGAHWVINVQADEPVLAEEHLTALFELMQTGVDMATLATPFTREEDFKDPNKVKVVCDSRTRALYFSRAPIPFDRDSRGGLPEVAFWHLGLYGYSAALLEEFQSWSPSLLECVEKLEQLRVLESGHSIGVGITRTRTIGIDVPEDIHRLEAAIADKDA